MACVCFAISACGFADLQPAGHTKMDDPLRFRAGAFASSAVRGDLLTAMPAERSSPSSINDVLAHAMNFGNAALLENRGHLCGRRFQWFLLPADPHGFDHVSRDALRKSASYGFYFGKFRHECWKIITTKGTKVHEGVRPALPCALVVKDFTSSGKFPCS